MLFGSDGDDMRKGLPVEGCNREGNRTTNVIGEIGIEIIDLVGIHIHTDDGYTALRQTRSHD